MNGHVHMLKRIDKCLCGDQVAQSVANESCCNNIYLLCHWLMRLIPAGYLYLEVLLLHRVIVLLRALKPLGTRGRRQMELKQLLPARSMH